MTKKEMKEKYYSQELEAVATISVTHNDYIKIFDIEHGIEDYVCGLYSSMYGESSFFRRKVYYSDDHMGAYFKIDSSKYYLSDAIRTNW